MTVTSFTLVSGTYSSAADLAEQLEFFMVNTIGGWERVKLLEDTGSAYTTVCATEGLVPNFYDKLNVKIEGSSTNILFTAMSDFNSDSETEYDSFGGNISNGGLSVGASGDYWIAANIESVHLVVDPGLVNFHGGFGHWVTYYNRLEDPKPFFTFGQASIDDTFQGSRVLSYAPKSWGKSMSTTNSGSALVYEALHPTILNKGTPNARSGSPKLIEPVFFTDSTYGQQEVRGEMPGVYLCGGSIFDAGNIVTITGTLGLAQGDYYIHKHNDNHTWAIGPVTISGS